MTFKETELPGVLLITPKVFKDSRGAFFESYHFGKYAEIGINLEFVQDNVSVSTANVIRGLHYQFPNPQAKLVQAISGSVYDVAVDLRAGSPHFGKWVGRVLSDENRCQLFIPEGFAHGFAVIGDHAILSYKCSTPFEASGDAAVRWNDPEIGVEWPFKEPILSEKDLNAKFLGEISWENLSQY